MKARIQNGVVVEILEALPGFALEDCFHPSILAQCVDAENLKVGDAYSPPAPQTPSAEQSAPEESPPVP